MRTQEQVATIGEFSVDAWNDVPMREALWASLRARAAEIASSRPGWALTDTPEDRSGPMYFRVVTAAAGETQDVETGHEHADFVRLRLVCWAAGD
jgi:hypothetical protein